MKLISLNTWGGRAGKEKLLKFFDRHKDVDIFCLQEIWSAPYKNLEGHVAGGLNINHADIMVYGMQEISSLLSNHNPYFRPHHLDNYGLLMLVKKELPIIKEGDVFVYKERGHMPEGDVGFHARNVQYLNFKTPEGNRTVMNFHGLWNGGGKGDSEDRIKQSENIIKFMGGLTHPFLITGDFNLMPDTQSIKMLEDSGLRNLVKENEITNTRTSFYMKPERFADYIFVSDGIKVNEFKMLSEEVSDHLPMYLDFG